MNVLSFALFFMLVCVAGWAQVTLWESYGSHGWRGLMNATVVGFDVEHVDQGSAALKLAFNTSAVSQFDAVESMDFLAQAPADLAEGFSLRVYAQAVSGAMGAPSFRFELVALDDTLMAGADTPLSLNAWTDITLPAATVTQAFKRIRLIMTTGSASGQFYLWADNMTRDGALFDAFESGFASSVQVLNIKGTAVGNVADSAHLVNSSAAPPVGSGLVYGAQWTGAQGEVLLRHRFSPSLDLHDALSLSFDVYIPAGIGLAVISSHFEDADEGQIALESVQPTSNGAWQSFSLDLGSLKGAPDFDPRSVEQMDMVLESDDTWGRAYFANVRVEYRNNQTRYWQIY